MNEVAPSVNWKEDLEYFVIAGCAVLSPDATNGFAWGNATLKVGILKGLCGYYDRAPSDVGGASVIAQEFTAFLTSKQPPSYSGDRVLDAWLEANRLYNARGIVYNNTQYWWVVGRFGPDKVEGPFNW